ncbi:response regulator transcription factor [Glutamicibacter sp. MNS18]|uniref:response regulator n=1 Tax=Glutamicibacter sp. MNS18 TaxID=2989817 RepID=UPI0022367B5C|nr:response regulator transcription factor [Glutamicibacter sp. MNS18]MCW4465850.1 response regulator transcription factor [Glutamicibacter sp. MNS18]
MEQIKVLIADDEPLIRRALGTILATDDAILLLNSVQNGQEAVEYCAAHDVDVVLMDLQMPIMDGVEATRLIKSSNAHTAVLAITAFSSDDYLVPVLLAGASGYLVKDTDPAQIVQAVISVHSGTAAISPSVSTDLITAVQRAYAKPAVAGDVADELGLTARELEILSLLAQGKNNTEICRILNVADTTVKTHMAKIFTKLGVRDRVQALIVATQLQLVDLNSYEIDPPHR